MSEPQTVLVVDDDPGVRDVVARLLSRAGYRCVEAPDVAGALAHLREALAPPCAIVSDAHMPGASAINLIRYAIQQRPSVPVLLMSAELRDPDLVDVVRRGEVPLLEKPFTAEQLIDGLRVLLQGVAPTPASEQGA